MWIRTNNGRNILNLNRCKTIGVGQRDSSTYYLTVDGVIIYDNLTKNGADKLIQHLLSSVLSSQGVVDLSTEYYADFDQVIK